MSSEDLLTILREGVENGRISPHLAAYIASEVLDTAPRDTGFDDQPRLGDEKAD
jgi:hypothetical protein